MPKTSRCTRRKKKRRKIKEHVAVINHSQQLHSNPVNKVNIGTAKTGSSQVAHLKKEQCTSVIVADQRYNYDVLRL
jgi:hypothetical protein